MFRSLFFTTGLLSLLPLASSANQAPVLDSLPASVSVPGGKSIVIPLTATDPDGDPLTYTVTSSSGSIIARVKTGLPFLKLNVTHTSSGEGDPSYSGSMAMALYRDWTPRTAENIAGLAQAGFFDGLLFQRLFKSSPVDIIQAGGSTSDSNYATVTVLPDEYQPQLIYSGTYQLAMANSGLDTDRSQFFITYGAQRLFDFNYTIFGQVTRGTDLVDSIRGTAVSGTSPLSPVTITSATVSPQSATGNTDGVLLLSAPGTDAASTITVTVTDSGNLSASRTITATPVTDTVDDPPFLAKPSKDQTVPQNTVVTIPLAITDLDYDLTEFTGRNVGTVNFPSKLQSAVTKKTALLLPPPSFRGPLSIQLGRYELGTKTRGNRQYSSSFLDISDTDVVNISVGDGSYSVTPLPLEATKGVALINITVARLLVTPPSGAKPIFVASINWGDNTISSGTLVKTATGYDIRGTHTYARGGTFPVTVLARDQFTVKQDGTTSTAGGARKIARFNAYVLDAAAQPIIVRGETLALAQKGKLKGTLATFTDASGATSIATDYTATIDWGDGHVTNGAIKALGSGKFSVSGTNIYADADDYSIGVQVSRTAGGAAANGFSRVAVGGARISMPPFLNVNVQGQWLQLKYKNTGVGTSLVGTITGQFKVQNTGKLASAAGKVTLFYSTDKFVDSSDTSLGTEITVPALQPGKSTILTVSAKAGASHAPYTLPTGVDISTVANANIVTKLQITHASPVIIDVNHAYVDRPVE